MLREAVQKLRVGVGVDVAACLIVEEGDEVRGVDEVAVDAHRQAVGGVDEEGLRLGTVVRVVLVDVKVEGVRCVYGGHM